MYAAVRDPKPEALVVHCSDPRFQPAFGRFIREELGLEDGRFIPLVVGGGGGVLAHPDQLPKEFKFLRERFEQYREIFPTVRRLVVFNHADCRYYALLRGKLAHLLGGRGRAPADEALADLGMLAKLVDRLLGHLGYQVDLYYARFADPEQTQIVFDKLDA